MSDQMVKMRALQPVNISAVGTVTKGETFAVNEETAKQLEDASREGGQLAERMSTENVGPAEGDENDATGRATSPDGASGGGGASEQPLGDPSLQQNNLGEVPEKPGDKGIPSI